MYKRQPYGGHAVTTGCHLCWSAPNRAAVDSFHQAAIAQGGRNNGAPGLRPEYHPNYYGAFVIDPDGNNVEIYSDMQQIAPDEPHEARVWERNVESFDQWRFARFVVPPPPAMVKEKQGAKS